MVTGTMERVKEAKKDIIWYLNKDKKYFMIEYPYVDDLLKEAHEIAHNINNFKLQKHNINELKLMISQLKKLEGRQRWQQIRSRYPKLRKAMANLLNLPIFNREDKRKVRDRIVELMKREHIFESDSLKKTAEEIEPLFRRKKLYGIKWAEIIAIITALRVDVQDLVYIVTELKKAIEEI